MNYCYSAIMTTQKLGIILVGLPAPICLKQTTIDKCTFKSFHLMHGMTWILCKQGQIGGGAAERCGRTIKMKSVGGPTASTTNTPHGPTLECCTSASLGAVHNTRTHTMPLAGCGERVEGIDLNCRDWIVHWVATWYSKGGGEVFTHCQLVSHVCKSQTDAPPFPPPLHNGLTFEENYKMLTMISRTRWLQGRN